jgi:hypothetical protein
MPSARAGAARLRAHHTIARSWGSSLHGEPLCGRVLCYAIGAPDCTLIVTEGLSAKTSAVAGLDVVGRAHFGVFPLRGKPLNVRGRARARARSVSVLVSTLSVLVSTFRAWQVRDAPRAKVRSYSMLCYAVLCYAMLCYAVLCCAVLCYAMLAMAKVEANAELHHLVAALGLRHGASYVTQSSVAVSPRCVRRGCRYRYAQPSQRAKLRYGHLMLMTDQARRCHRPSPPPCSQPDATHSPAPHTARSLRRTRTARTSRGWCSACCTTTGPSPDPSHALCRIGCIVHVTSGGYRPELLHANFVKEFVTPLVKAATSPAAPHTSPPPPPPPPHHHHHHHHPPPPHARTPHPRAHLPTGGLPGRRWSAAAPSSAASSPPPSTSAGSPRGAPASARGCVTSSTRGWAPRRRAR